MSSGDIDNIFDRAASGKSLVKKRETLTIDYVPEKLPFRDREATALAQTLSTVFKGARPSNLLLFGKPGTGKTAVVRTVVDRLKKKSGELGITVNVPIINAKLANSAYKMLFEIAENLGLNKEEKKVVHFTGLSMGEATDRILQFIQNKKMHVILVIDEIDSLVDRNGDDVLYSFTRANERMGKGGFVSLIGISNSLTFKDKLDPRVRSSLSEEETVFNPYTVEQLRQILSERARLAFNEGAITDAAINLCAAMAGREHGDARKAIDLLRVAAELAEREHVLKVEEKHVRAAQEKIEKDTNLEVIRNATTHTKFVMLAITKSKNGNTGEVYETYSSLCKQVEQEPLTQRRVTQIISELDQLGLVSTDVVSQGRYGRSQKIKVAVPLATVQDALKDDPTFSDLLL
ncbi:orc1/cdc6 family replication initiation protein [Candidatus Nitrososphaera evergladensis SR1]|jgi:cell division control protein 6|uniref:ORC1-type DNA replication protein n=1 Tax=Candidatus Nitrososphaera evergladensis SR1 TaxID=1459636 RepID=A0A075MLL6_9ARCH|nr:AAA family ATPase [Candidatus Nitrososphaera evergladensis]AIF82168.1 orc1/cdc6 family replication initiation protein [Candidatus Nitrososphaera evergladensis SR1]